MRIRPPFSPVLHPPEHSVTIIVIPQVAIDTLHTSTFVVTLPTADGPVPGETATWPVPVIADPRRGQSRTRRGQSRTNWKGSLQRTLLVLE
jgi:hypothetical protein